MHWAESEGKLPKGTAKRWAHHTKDIKKLPEHVSDKEKKAFVATFLLKCAAAGMTSPEAIASAAEKYADEMEKAADISSLLGDAAGRSAGLIATGAGLGLALPLVGGYAAGRLAGSAKNQIDTDDAESLRISALANAYRRRTAEAKMNAQVRDIVSSDPSKYVVVG